MKKKLKSLVLALAMTTGLMACGSSEKPGESTPAAAVAQESKGEGESSESVEGITLRWVGAGWSQNDKEAKIIEKWKAIHPDIAIDYIELGTTVDESYLTNLDTMISGGEVVDLTYLTYDDVYKRVINGGALPLDSYIQAAGDNYEEMYGTLSTAMLTYSNEIYGVPYAGNTFKVFYNKTMTDQAGITIPETWSCEEFTQAAKALNNPSEGIYGCVFPYLWDSLNYVSAELCGWQPVRVEADGTIVPNFDDETFKTAMVWARNLSVAEKVSPDMATQQSESLNRRQALATGQAAMIMDGPFTLVWMQNYMFNDPGEGPLPFELGVTNVPYINETGKDVSYNKVAGAFYVPKSSQYPAEAYEFMKFICNECPEESANYMPIYTGADMEAATKSFTEYIDANGETHTEVYSKEVAEGAVATPFESHIGRYKYNPALAAEISLMNTLFAEQYGLYMYGEMEMDEWVEMMQQMGEAELHAAQ